jgi:aryl-alcohol dehydrogenase-like predicted oxidoreductase
LVDRLSTTTDRQQAAPASIALACLLAQPLWSVAILRTTKLHRLEENTGAASIELTPDDLREIESAASQLQMQGARYPEHVQQLTGR